MSGLWSRVYRRIDLQSKISLYCVRRYFKREEGFFVGAIMANVVATEVVILVVYFSCLLFTEFDERNHANDSLLRRVTFPLAFYHHSWRCGWNGSSDQGLPHGQYRER